MSDKAASTDQLGQQTPNNSIEGTEPPRVKRQVEDDEIFFVIHKLLTCDEPVDDVLDKLGLDVTGEGLVMTQRARKVQRFMRRHFSETSTFASELFAVGVNIGACWQILQGDYDRVPEEAFCVIGGLEEVSAKARKLSRSDRYRSLLSYALFSAAGLVILGLV